MTHPGWKQWYSVAVLAAEQLITSLYALRTVRRAVYWRLHRDEVIRPWMSVACVAHSYRVPPHVLYESLGIAPQPHDRRPTRDIAREQNRSVEEVIATLQNAIVRERAQNPSGSQSPSPGRSP